MTTKRPRIFLSVGRQKDARHIEFVAALKNHLDLVGLEVFQLPNSYENPLDRVVAELKQCDGALVVCFERLYAKSAQEFRLASERSPPIAPLVAPTVWNHVEAALARSLKLPVLVIAEEGCRAEGMLDAIVQLKVHWMKFDKKLLTQKYFRQLFDSWKSAVEIARLEPKSVRIERAADLRFVDILKSLKVGDVVGVLSAAAVVFFVGWWFGANFPMLG